MIDREKACDLRAKGLTYAQIAKQLRCTESGAYYACNRDVQRKNWAAYCKARKARDPGWVESERARLRKWHRKNTLGIVDATDECGSGACEICKRTGLRLCLDHDHRTGLRRGWLCVSCNRGLGYLGDSSERLQSALSYLNGRLIVAKVEV